MLVFSDDLLAKRGAHCQLGQELQPPARDHNVVAVSPVWVVEVEDRFDGLGAVGDAPFVGDIGSTVGVGCEYACALFTKGVITASEYSSSASSEPTRVESCPRGPDS